MAVTRKNIIPGSVLGTTVATYYTAPASTRTLINKLTITNVTGNARTVTIHLIPSGGAAGDANTITKTKSLAALETAEIFEAEGHVLEAGAFIQALADAATALTIMASGAEIV